MAELRLLDRLTQKEFEEYLRSSGVNYDVCDSKVELEPVKVVIPRCSNLKPRWFWIEGGQVAKEFVYNDK